MLKVGQLVKLGYERQPYRDTGIVLTTPEPYWDEGDDPTYVKVYWQKKGEAQAEYEHDLVPYDPKREEFVLIHDFEEQPWVG
tara:strand:+ start:194 stop:439 length:246 start_codon:yes stop_codon:yes gene_type:complete